MVPMIVRVYDGLEEHASGIDVPLTPDTTCRDLIECCRDPGDEDCELVGIWAGQCECTLRENDRPLEILQKWGTGNEPVKLMLRYTPLQEITSSTTGNSQNGGVTTSEDIWTPPITNPPILRAQRRILDVPNATLKKDECGLPDLLLHPKITNGVESSAKEWPWHIALYIADKNPTSLKYECGGTLISKNFVLTAAHCVTDAFTAKPMESKLFLVSLGRDKLLDWSHEGIQGKGVSKIIVHPSYDKESFQYDLALLQLSTPVQYTSYVKPICLWQGNDSIAMVVGKYGKVAGWGRTRSHSTTTSNKLRMTDMPVVAHQDCVTRMRTPKGQAYYNRQLNQNSSFCAGFLEQNPKSVCNGDSGGGMIFPIPETVPVQWQLRGVVSTSSKSESSNDGCNPHDYVIFTDAARLTKSWILPEIDKKDVNVVKNFA